jgi:hypothetical protein
MRHPPSYGEVNKAFFEVWLFDKAATVTQTLQLACDYEHKSSTVAAVVAIPGATFVLEAGDLVVHGEVVEADWQDGHFDVLSVTLTAGIKASGAQTQSEESHA